MTSLRLVSASWKRGIPTGLICFCQNSLNQDYNLNISGGANNTTYYVSLGYSDNKGTVKGDNMRRYNFKMNLNTKLWNFLKVGTQLFLFRPQVGRILHGQSFDYALYASRYVGSG